MPSVELIKLLNRQHAKDDVVAFLNKDNKNFKQAIALVQSTEQPYAWRAAWMLCHASKKQDKRILPLFTGYHKSDSQQKGWAAKRITKSGDEDGTFARGY